MATLQYKFTSDILFKMLFTQHEALLRSLVAAALGIMPGDIETLIIRNPEIAPAEIGDKFCRLDLNMVINDELVDLEIQVGDEGNFRERTLYYWARLFSTSLAEGGDYRDAPRTLLISILDFDLFDGGDVCSEFAVMEKARHEILTDRLGIIFYELRKLPDMIDRNDMLQIWLKLISARTEEDLAEIERMEVDEMAQAVNAYKQITGTTDYQELERMRSKARHDEAQALSNARRQNSKEIAKRMKEAGEPSDKIICFTGLSAEEIAAL